MVYEKSSSLSNSHQFAGEFDFALLQRNQERLHPFIWTLSIKMMIQHNRAINLRRRSAKRGKTRFEPMTLERQDHFVCKAQGVKDHREISFFWSSEGALNSWRFKELCSAFRVFSEVSMWTLFLLISPLRVRTSHPKRQSNCLSLFLLPSLQVDVNCVSELWKSDCCQPLCFSSSTCFSYNSASNSLSLFFLSLLRSLFSLFSPNFVHVLASYLNDTQFKNHSSIILNRQFLLTLAPNLPKDFEMVRAKENLRSD